MNRTNRWVACCVLVIGVSGCATLTQSQVEAINQYTDITTHYSAYPSKVLSDFTTIRYANRLLIASQTSDRDNPLTFQEISRLYEQKKQETEAAQGLDVGIQAIDTYAMALQKLSSPDFAKDAGTNAQALATSLDSLTNRYNTVVKPTVNLPFVGTAVSLTLREVGQRYIGYKQTAALKRYVQAGDPLVSALATNLEKIMASHTTVYIQELEKDLGTFDNLLLKQLANSAHYERYQFAVETMTTLEKIDKLKEANQQSINALRKLRSAHNELTIQVRQKQKMINVGKELFGFYKAVQTLQTTYQTINK